jgi:hypothetical protein
MSDQRYDIDYLVLRKFKSSLRPDEEGNRQTLMRRYPELAPKIEFYAQELEALENDECNDLYDIERAKEDREIRLEEELNERRRFPSARADFRHWSKAANWTLDEAIALSFGRDPKNLNWESVLPHLEVSAFAIQYGRLRDLALRALQQEQLHDPVVPETFLAWARHMDVIIAPDLEAAIAAQNAKIVDWQSEYNRALEELEESREALKAMGDKATNLEESLAAARRLNENLAFRIEQSLSKNADLAQSLRETTETRDAAVSRATQLQLQFDTDLRMERPIPVRERESLLKLVIGMAIKGYTYDPKAPRNAATSDITSDLELLGIGLDVDTVRKWLKAGADTLPGPITS